ncbi:hypothetical protein ScPMuIL_015522 [Solemya velum]
MAFNLRAILLRVLTDAVIIATFGLCLLLYKLKGEPYERGFFCDDQSLMYPYHSSGLDTISSTVLYTVGFVLPLLTFILVELVRAILNAKEQRLQSDQRNNLFVKNFYFVAVPFVFGAAMEHLTTDIANTYVTDFTCTGSEYSKEVRLSFPSGHASFSVYTMVFNMLYLQSRFNFKYSMLFKPFLQLLLFYMAFYTCLSRIFNNKHHWSDVLVGALIGVVAAFITAYLLAKLFPRKKEPPKQTESNCVLTQVVDTDDNNKRNSYDLTKER